MAAGRAPAALEEPEPVAYGEELQPLGRPREPRPRRAARGARRPAGTLRRRARVCPPCTGSRAGRAISA